MLRRYKYNGVGETATWHSSRNYLVVDLAAGPSTYGPLASQGGAVTPQALPSIKVRCWQHADDHPSNLHAWTAVTGLEWGIT